MIEVLNVQAVNKGMVLAKCDVHIIPWKMTLREIIIFQKGAQRWITMPSKQYTNDEGQIKYTELVVFDNETIRNKFRSQITNAIDKFLDQNPNLEPEDVIKESDDLPF